MQTSLGICALCLGLGLIGCDRPNRDQPSARQAGRDAYHATQDLKRDAKDAARQLRQAGKQFREGWSEAKHQDANRDEPRNENDTRRNK